MKRIINVSKVQEALDSAAHDALHGASDVRAGRFVATDASISLPQGKRRSRRSRSAAGSHVAERRSTKAR
jgi:hypothetical protein